MILVETYPTSLPLQLKIVGGTFSLTGASSVSQFQSLSKILRLSTFLCLSLILEQHILLDSHVHLHFPAEIPSQPMAFSYSAPEMPSNQTKPHAKQSPGGFWSFISKTKDNIMNRAMTTSLAHSYSRTKSLDISPVIRSPSHPPTHYSPLSRRAQRLSFHLSPGSSRMSAEQERKKHESSVLFKNIVERLLTSSSLLSSSAGIVFPPPRILSELAEKEKANPGRRLFGYEKVSLSSLLGWEGRESYGKSMTGLSGFVRHQGISFLYAEYAPRNQRQASQVSPSTTSQSSSSEGDSSKRQDGSVSEQSTASKVSASALFPCERGRWITYRYFTRELEHRKRKCADRTLGDAIESFCTDISDKDTRCEKQHCGMLKSDHLQIWIHAGVSVSMQSCERSVTDADLEKRASESGNDIFTWESCEICQKETRLTALTDGA